MGACLPCLPCLPLTAAIPGEKAGKDGGRVGKFVCSQAPLPVCMPNYRQDNYKRFCAWGVEYGALPVDPKIMELRKVAKEAGITDDDDQLVFIYTLNDVYAEVNHALYTDSEDGLKRWGGYIGELRRVMHKKCVDEGQNYQKGLVYIGLNLPKELTDVFQPSQKFLFPNFRSASKLESVVSSTFTGNVVLKINIADARGLTYALDIARYSKFPDEEEVLFYPYSGFEVMKRDVAPDGKLIIEARLHDTTLIDTKTEGTTPFRLQS